MKIQNLRVNNFRGFAGERLFELSENFTVVAGVNGRGKTAILDGLALLISRMILDLALSARSQRNVASTDVFVEADKASLTMKTHCAGFPLKFGVELRRRGKAVRTVRVTRLPPAVKRQIMHNYKDPAKADERMPVAVYYTTDRAGFRLPRNLPTKLPSSQQMAHNGALSNRMVDYREFIARYRVWASQKQPAKAAFDKALGNFLAEFSEVSVDESPLRLTIRKGKHRLSLAQLSDGERSFFALLGDIVRRLALANPDLGNPLEGPGVVLIDELELHLHPTWQREVVEKLRTTFPNIQFIGTTHSPFVIQSLRLGELINLDPDEFGDYADRSIEDIAENVMGVYLPQKSKRYLNMMQAAEQYFALLQSSTSSVDVQKAEERLAELAMPFSDDPAFQALLKLERVAMQGGDPEAR